jgi:hypothetical protein
VASIHNLIDIGFIVIVKREMTKTGDFLYIVTATGYDWAFIGESSDFDSAVTECYEKALAFHLKAQEREMESYNMKRVL